MFVLFYAVRLFVLVDDGVDKLIKCRLTFVRIFEDGGGVKDAFAGVVDIIGDCLARLLFAYARAVVHDELGYHAEVFVERMLILCNCLEVKRSFARQDVAHIGHFFCKSAWQDKHAHDFDYADRLLLDVVEFNCRVEDAKRMRLVRPVVAKDEIELIFAVLIY